MLAFIVGLRAEGKLTGGSVFVGGGEPAGAVWAVTAAVECGARAMVSFGLAGGLCPALPPGALVVPRSVLWHGVSYATDTDLNQALGGADDAMSLAGEAVVSGVQEKAKLWASTRAAIVDLESGVVAEAASQAGLPFAVLRAVCDPAGRTLPPAALLALDTTGAIGWSRVAGSLFSQPGQIGALLALARDAARARQALAGRMRAVRASGALSRWEA